MRKSEPIEQSAAVQLPWHVGWGGKLFSVLLAVGFYAYVAHVRSIGDDRYVRNATFETYKVEQESRKEEEQKLHAEVMHRIDAQLEALTVTTRDTQRAVQTQSDILHELVGEMRRFRSPATGQIMAPPTRFALELDTGERAMRIIAQAETNTP